MGEDCKHYIIDTSSLMEEPNCLQILGEGNIVYLHQMVLNELDRNTDNPAVFPYARGNAKKALRIIGELLKKYDGQPIPVGKEGKIVPIHSFKSYSHADPALLELLQERKAEGEEAILVTEDTGLIALARFHQCKAEVLKEKRKGRSIHEILNLPETITLSYQQASQLKRERTIRIKPEETETSLDKLVHNQYLTVEGCGRIPVRHTSSGNEHCFSTVSIQKCIKGIHTKNEEQKYLMHMCLDPGIQVATVLGKAGTGKTLITLAAALYQVITRKEYGRLIIIRPVEYTGKELGYLPGDYENKIGPLMAPIFDNAEVIFNHMRRKIGKEDDDEIETSDLKYLIKGGIVTLDTPTFIRGRNIPHSFILVDEAQNIDEDTIKTIATRAGEGSKIVFNGDPYQIDHPYLDQEKNGLVHLTKAFLGESIFSTVILKKTERGPVAELAAKLL